MCVFESFGAVERDQEGGVGRDRLAARAQKIEHACQVEPTHQIDRDEILRSLRVDLVDASDARIIEARVDLRRLDEPVDEALVDAKLRVKPLDRELLFEA